MVIWSRSELFSFGMCLEASFYRQKDPWIRLQLPLLLDRKLHIFASGKRVSISMHVKHFKLFFQIRTLFAQVNVYLLNLVSTATLSLEWWNIMMYASVEFTINWHIVSDASPMYSQQFSQILNFIPKNCIFDFFRLDSSGSVMDVMLTELGFCNTALAVQNIRSAIL